MRVLFVMSIGLSCSSYCCGNRFAAYSSSILLSYPIMHATDGLLVSYVGAFFYSFFLDTVTLK